MDIRSRMIAVGRPVLRALREMPDGPDPHPPGQPLWHRPTPRHEALAIGLGCDTGPWLRRPR